MKITLETTGTGCELNVALNWKSLTKFFKALGPVLTALIALMFAPEIHQIGQLFGFW